MRCEMTNLKASAHVESVKMDKLDIFEIPMDTKIITTIEELQRLYIAAYDDGATLERCNAMGWKSPEEKPTIVHGDIV